MNSLSPVFAAAQPAHSTLTGIDWVMIALYFGILLCVAWWVVRKSKDTAADYFLAGRNSAGGSSARRSSPPTSARNTSSDWPARGATSGVAMAHYELHAWCLLVLAWVFVPFYMRSHGLHHARVSGAALHRRARATCSRSSR